MGVEVLIMMRRLFIVLSFRKKNLRYFNYKGGIVGCQGLGLMGLRNGCVWLWEGVRSWAAITPSEVLWHHFFLVFDSIMLRMCWRAAAMPCVASGERAAPKVKCCAGMPMTQAVGQRA